MKESVKNKRQQKVYKERKVWKRGWGKKGSKKFIKKESVKKERQQNKERNVRKKVRRKKGRKKFIKKEK